MSRTDFKLSVQMIELTNFQSLLEIFVKLTYYIHISRGDNPMDKIPIIVMVQMKNYDPLNK